MKKLLSVLVVTGLFTALLQAQQQPLQLNPNDVDVSKLEVEVQKTPSFGASGVKDKNIPSPRDWLEMEAEFEVKGPRDAVAKELLFRYYVGFRDQDGQAVTLTGDVKHVNVVAGEKYYSAVYVAPSTLGEITGDFRRFQLTSIEASGVEVYFNGVIVQRKSSMAGNAAFWTSTAVKPGILAKEATPFALLWIDRYAESAKTP